MGAIQFIDGWTEPDETGESSHYVRQATATFIPVNDEFLAYLEDRIGTVDAVDIINSSAIGVTARSLVSAADMVNHEDPVGLADAIWRQLHAQLGPAIIQQLDPPPTEEEDANAEAA